ncbi:hypothetical protein E4K66_25475 [Bradyrhizobium frederickii]|uniref:Uncharacterized protein n=1 Tax=Bradyrhizobium frederickii TaxID=2560054 RepID=A0A4Y9L1E9_9BRAD|nr:hypothetical protein [Bradyrhizobium frederickii]TFV35672.1 hypothetical protein E4K66_25475 [Bradyrhizobium frederickii]
MQASQQNIEGGVLTNIAHEDGRHVSAIMPDFAPNSPLSKSMANLAAAQQNFAANINVANSQFLPEARATHLQAAARNVIAKPFAAAQAAAQDEARAINAAKARALTVDPATEATAPIRSRGLAQWDAAETIADKAALVQKLPYEGLAALIQSGVLNETPDDIRKIALDRYMLERHISLTGLQANFQKQPTADDPIATGPDIEAATNAAQRALDTLNARSESIDDARTALQSTVTMVALATELNLDQAFSLIATTA